MQKNFPTKFRRDEKGDDYIKCTNMKGSSISLEDQNKRPETGPSLNQNSENSKNDFEIMNLRKLRDI